MYKNKLYSFSLTIHFLARKKIKIEEITMMCGQMMTNTNHYLLPYLDIQY